MKHCKLHEALNEISDKHIEAAAKGKTRRSIRWLAPIAAVLALAVLIGMLHKPAVNHIPDETAPGILQIIDPTSPLPEINHGIQAQYLLGKAEYPKMHSYPLLSNDMDAYDLWRKDQLAMHTQPEDYTDSLNVFWGALMQEIMCNPGNGNITCSPVNIYMALAMLAETTDGQSRQQILDVLGADSIEALRTQAKNVWQAHYNNDTLSTSILANSLWLEEGYGFDADTVKLLVENYYTSVFQGDLGSEEMNKVLQAWLDEQTGGLLQEQIQDVKMDPRTVLALASTVYYQVQWVNDFQEAMNTEETFFGADGSSTETFMHQTLSYGPYYWSDRFGAVALNLEDGSRMWLFLPDEGIAPKDIVSEVQSFLAQDPAAYNSTYKNQKSLIVNLSLPKFDISADLDLGDTLQNMGITDIFVPGTADFSPILTQEDGGYISDVQHAARVAIDEKGVTAAAFTLIMRAGAGMPPDEEMDFVLNRPFLFFVESQDHLPLFTGIVNNP